MADPNLPDDLSVQAGGSLKPHVIDPWTFLDYKQAFGSRGGKTWTAPTWTGDHNRRLQAYKVYEDYYRNCARGWLSLEASDQDSSSRREYGEPFVVVEQYLNSLLGDDQSIVVPNAIGKGANSPEVTYQTMIREWADREIFDLKVEENERNIMKLGDGVYVLGEDNDGNPLVEVWDPGFYFPVLDPDTPSSQYPQKVHIAYEFERVLGNNEKRRYVRRKTYELVQLVVGDEEVPAQIKYPWNDKPTDIACFYSEAIWELGQISSQHPREDLDWNNASEVVQEPIDLGIDFIPVVHIPNLVPSLAEHYGISILGSVMQLFDDLVGTDTDLQRAAATTGSPPISLNGAMLPTDTEGRITTYGPGQVFMTGDGTANLLDTSKSLDALLKLDEHLLERLSVNGRIPESMLGRVKPSEVPSGIALTISFGPHRGVIAKMRKIRRRKYAILFKFIGRILQKNNKVDQTFLVEYHFGSFLPSDRQETINLVIQGLTANPPAISMETGIRMLVEAGFPIEDAKAEADRIRKEDYTSAGELLDATGDTAVVRERLGLGAATPGQQAALPAATETAPPA